MMIGMENMFVDIILFIGMTTSAIIFLILCCVGILTKPKVPQIKFILTNEYASCPERGTSFSAGYDLKSSEDCVVPARS